MKLLRRGKVKDVFEVDDETLEFLFSDRISVFDKIIPSDIPHKGETLCRTSAHWFKTLEAMDIGTHFVDLSSENRMKVRRLQVLDRLDKDSRNCIIPLEFIVRHYVAGSLYDRIRNGELEPGALGLSAGDDPYGKMLASPFFEMTTKFEKFDRKVEPNEAMDISGLTEDELQDIEEIILRIDDKIGGEVRQRGLIHVDGKKEFGLDSDRNIIIVDTFGTADEDRFWDLDRYERGECVELSKELVRQYYRKTKYYDELNASREKGIAEPEIPPLPEKMVDEVSALYVNLYEKITGKVFR